MKVATATSVNRLFTVMAWKAANLIVNGPPACMQVCLKAWQETYLELA